jgi:PAS domain S-box-containing protein
MPFPDSDDIADLVADGLVLIRQGRIESANRAMLGLTRAFASDKLVGQPARVLWPQLDLTRLEPLTLATMVRLDGVQVPVSIRFDRSRQHHPDEFLLAVRDASQHAQTPAQRLAPDLCPDAVFVVDVETLDYVDVNRAACELLGTTREELIGRGPVAGWVRTGSKVEAFREILGLLVRTSPATSVSRQVWQRTDGTMVPVAIVASAQQLQGRWVVYANVTPVAAQGDMSASPDTFRSAIDLNPDAVWLMDYATRRCIEANERAAALLGRTHDELLAGGFDLIWPAGDEARAELDRFLAALVACSPQAQVREMKLRRADGREIPVEMSCNAIVSQSRWVFFLHARDISARVAAQAEIERRISDLERSNAELESFAYVISHDLSEPLRMVTSYLQLLVRRYGDRLEGDAQEFIGFAVEGGQRMQRLIDDLLLYSRVGRRGTQQRVSTIDVVMGEVLKNLRPLIRESGATVEVQQLAALPCDRMLMQQLLQNLLGNALKFRAERPLVVRVRARRGDAEWIISVEDNGIGIEPRYFDRIFAIFQRLHPRGTYDGTGIGLAVCKKIVAQMGGRIWVESVPGEGSCFSFTIPDAHIAALHP